MLVGRGEIASGDELVGSSGWRGSVCTVSHYFGWRNCGGNDTLLMMYASSSSVMKLGM